MISRNRVAVLQRWMMVCLSNRQSQPQKQPQIQPQIQPQMKQQIQHVVRDYMNVRFRPSSGTLPGLIRYLHTVYLKSKMMWSSFLPSKHERRLHTGKMLGRPWVLASISYSSMPSSEVAPGSFHFSPVHGDMALIYEMTQQRTFRKLFSAQSGNKCSCTTHFYQTQLRAQKLVQSTDKEPQRNIQQSESEICQLEVWSCQTQFEEFPTSLQELNQPCQSQRPRLACLSHEEVLKHIPRDT